MNDLKLESYFLKRCVGGGGGVATAYNNAKAPFCYEITIANKAKLPFSRNKVCRPRIVNKSIFK